MCRLVRIAAAAFVTFLVLSLYFINQFGPSSLRNAISYSSIHAAANHAGRDSSSIPLQSSSTADEAAAKHASRDSSSMPLESSSTTNEAFDLSSSQVKHTSADLAQSDIDEEPQSIAPTSSATEMSSSREVAICFVGHLRGFIYRDVRERAQRLFFDVMAGMLFINVVAEASCPLSRSSLSRVLSNLGLPVAFLRIRNYTDDVPFKLNEDCGIKPEYTVPAQGHFDGPVGEKLLERLAGQWARLAECFREVEKYEQRESFRFVYIVRTRPDILFLSSMPAIKQLEKLAGKSKPTKTILVPIGGTTQKYNDHLAVCTRDVAGAYFLGSEDLDKCHSDFKKQFGYDITFGSAPTKVVFYEGKVMQSKAHIYKFKLIYSLLRSPEKGKKCSPACYRIDLLYRPCYGNAACQKNKAECLTVGGTACKRGPSDEVVTTRLEEKIH